MNVVSESTVGNVPEICPVVGSMSSHEAAVPPSSLKVETTFVVAVYEMLFPEIP